MTFIWESLNNVHFEELKGEVGCCRSMYFNRSWVTQGRLESVGLGGGRRATLRDHRPVPGKAEGGTRCS